MSNKLSIPVYLISLEQDCARRKALEKRFPKYYSDFIHIKAIDGRKLTAKEYYEATIEFFHKHKRPMSPAELGCSLSHIQALESFLKTDESFALIIEDDVIGLDSDLELIVESLTFFSSNSIVFVGCQEGLMNRYKYGFPLNNSLLKVPKYNYGNFSRTAAYMVSRKVAEVVLSYHKKNYITVADFWFDLLKGSNVNTYYINRLAHPLDLQDSNLEVERSKFKRGFFKKVLSYKVVMSRISQEVKFFYYKLKGYKNIGRFCE